MSETAWEEQLLQRIAAKDSDALEQLYDRYERPVYAFVYRIVGDVMASEEIVQELFFKVWNHAESFDLNRRTGKVSTWMFTLARNLSIDWIRKRDRRPAASGSEEDWQGVKDPETTEQAAMDRLMAEHVKEALAELNEEQKRVLEWVYYGGYTQQEISELHHIPLGTVKSRVRLALRQLRKSLGEVWREGVRS
ncbi:MULTISPECIES: sigma-70 family RNA polymerase sigma factor [unclassified Paenibacillus]|uniref:RNA polymerase sigma factor n=1 Tax=unclassified Paenibacillus TaxID=185978 RepID=UPI000954A876|nr:MULTISPECIES: sigma-70 family RNA polymerase sigma factor [unclassified Paenibacillus]ASS66270.1 sigma-70 family RNA polymerase sigma factor [Paenibacillus sp. RUD330]SIQ09544.1 RNA polymerase sigma-70 factor, ECF subfamily [Paenibacillus sp. RU4X]SIQ29939.1 RNA polymerase sigma-70 factor, ECF subfamily [Paenibacillus sp. RU4T]